MQKESRLGKILDILIFVLCPVAVFLVVENYTHLLSEMWAGPVKLNIVLYLLIFFTLFFLFGRISIGYTIGILVIGLFGLANYFVLLFRSAPIMPWDLYSIGIAATVADNFDYVLSRQAVIVIVLLIVLAVLCIRSKLKIKNFKIRVILLVFTATLCVSYVRYIQTDDAANRFTIDTTLFTPKVMYRNNGLLLSFLINAKYIFVEEPSGYSAGEVARIGESIQSTPVIADGDYPNIIVVMNEAFSDLRVLGDYETNMEVMPFLDGLYEHTQRGFMYASVKGGNTANTEYEFLTGDSLYWLPVGSVPYQQYIRDELPSIPSQLSALGYKTVAMHPYNASGWNRNTIYDLMGFDKKLFLKNFYEPEKIRTYVSDRETFHKIIDLYEEKDKGQPLFVFDVTMQNHGSYTKLHDNFDPQVKVRDAEGRYLYATEQYLSLLRETDIAFRELVEYFEAQHEKTIILMFGDHQPADYIVRVISGEDELTLESQQKRYMVPYYLWANYDIDEESEGLVSANYLGVKLLETAGIGLTDYETFLKALAQKIPVITANMAMDKEGNYYERHSNALDELLHDYAMLQYNHMADIKHRNDALFQ